MARSLRRRALRLGTALGQVYQATDTKLNRQQDHSVGPSL